MVECGQEQAASSTGGPSRRGSIGGGWGRVRASLELDTNGNPIVSASKVRMQEQAAQALCDLAYGDGECKMQSLKWAARHRS